MKRFLILLTLATWLGCASDPWVRVRPFSPANLNSGQTEALHRFKANADGDRLAEARVLEGFLPHCLDRRTLAIDWTKMRYRIGRDQVERMLGAPEKVENGQATFDKTAPRHSSDFSVLEYKLSPVSALTTGNHLWITLYKGWVVDTDIPGVITF